VSEARRLAKAARERVDEGHQLTDVKREEKAARSTAAKNTFELVAARWVKHTASAEVVYELPR